MTDHQVIYRKDYQPPAYTIGATDLSFVLNDNLTTVTSRLKMTRNVPEATSVRLHGENLKLISVAIDGEPLANNEYRVDQESLRLENLPETFELSVVTEICPEENTALEGLYKSGSMYCTQCEAEGFRNITYYLDQPDVLSVFTVDIEADAQRYPVALANGNKIEDTDLGNGRRRVRWNDPFPKPSYLFALVAGDLSMVDDSFVTMSGRTVRLEIYTEPENIKQCDYAMQALKRSMRWDEEVYGREYDLDVFMIVAVSDFNMGAMENKGLNIFNTSCVLATPDTATDAGYERVEAVVAHEYFHNWSGNRVTCRDWFQLSLKEGFTVFRDAEFSADMNAATVKRIEDVAFLRAAQFAEDAGPMAHSIRPDSYIQIDNFYTTTVYEKGAEVVRMLHTLLGAQGFRRGSDLYFDRHDGQAVTTNDFVCAMEDANNVTLDEFRHWYAQAGTPRLSINQIRAGNRLSLTLEQSCPATPGQAHKQPFHIPFKLGLIDANGAEIDIAAHQVSASTDVHQREDGLLIELKEAKTEIHLDEVPQGAVVSALRGFSAPVVLASDRSEADLAHLVAHDTDGFSRWDACQTLFANDIARRAGAEQANTKATKDASAQLIDLMGTLLDQAVASDAPEEQALLAKLLTLPSEADLFERQRPVDVLRLLEARTSLETEISLTHGEKFSALYQGLGLQKPYSPDAASIAHRALRNRALAGIARSDASVSSTEALLRGQFERADNLTDRRAVLAILLDVPGFSAPVVQELLDRFYADWSHEALVVDNWISLQAGGQLEGALARVERIEAHEAFDSRNPNKVRSLYGAFAMNNHANFHQADGSGYRFLAERIRCLNATNPQIASRLTGPLTQWQRYIPAVQVQMRVALQEILALESLSPNVYELVSKSLEASD